MICAREGFGLQIIDNEIEANGCTGIGTEGTYPYIFRNVFSPQNIDCSRTGEDVLIVSGGAFFHQFQSCFDTIAGPGGGP